MARAAAGGDIFDGLEPIYESTAVGSNAFGRPMTHAAAENKAVSRPPPPPHHEQGRAPNKIDVADSEMEVAKTSLQVIPVELVNDTSGRNAAVEMKTETKAQILLLSNDGSNTEVPRDLPPAEKLEAPIKGYEHCEKDKGGGLSEYNSSELSSSDEETDEEVLSRRPRIYPVKRFGSRSRRQTSDKSGIRLWTTVMVTWDEFPTWPAIVCPDPETGQFRDQGRIDENGLSHPKVHCEFFEAGTPTREWVLLNSVRPYVIGEKPSIQQDNEFMLDLTLALNQAKKASKIKIRKRAKVLGFVKKEKGNVYSDEDEESEDEDPFNIKMFQSDPLFFRPEDLEQFSSVVFHFAESTTFALNPISVACQSRWIKDIMLEKICGTFDEDIHICLPDFSKEMGNYFQQFLLKGEIEFEAMNEKKLFQTIYKIKDMFSFLGIRHRNGLLCQNFPMPGNEIFNPDDQCDHFNEHAIKYEQDDGLQMVVDGQASDGDTRTVQLVKRFEDENKSEQKRFCKLNFKNRVVRCPYPLCTKEVFEPLLPFHAEAVHKPVREVRVLTEPNDAHWIPLEGKAFKVLIYVVQYDTQYQRCPCCFAPLPTPIIPFHIELMHKKLLKRIETNDESATCVEFSHLRLKGGEANSMPFVLKLNDDDLKPSHCHLDECEEVVPNYLMPHHLRKMHSFIHIQFQVLNTNSNWMYAPALNRKTILYVCKNGTDTIECPAKTILVDSKCTESGHNDCVEVLPYSMVPHHLDREHRFKLQGKREAKVARGGMRKVKAEGDNEDSPTKPANSSGKGRKRKSWKRFDMKIKDCGTCMYCLDKPKFGGSNTMKQKCIVKKAKQEEVETGGGKNGKHENEDSTAMSDDDVMGKKDVICEHCGKFFKLLTRSHTIQCSGGLACKHCPNSYPNERALDWHVSTNHPESLPPQQSICADCGMGFGMKENLERHKRTHNSEVTCNHCRKSFISKKILERHILNKHSADRDKHHMCNICGKKFGTETSLKHHSRHVHDIISEPSRPTFKCSLCSKKFSSRNNQVAHEEHCQALHLEALGQLETHEVEGQESIKLEELLEQEDHSRSRSSSASAAAAQRNPQRHPHNYSTASVSGGRPHGSAAAAAATQSMLHNAAEAASARALAQLQQQRNKNLWKENYYDRQTLRM